MAEKIKHEKSAGIIIYFINAENKPEYLLLKYPTYWGFAKGIIEENEREEETALREAEEETNLKNLQLIPGFKHIQKWFFRFKGQLVSKEAVFFLAKIPEKEKDNVKLSFEHEDFCFSALEESLEKMKIKSNREMLEKAEKFILEYEEQKRLG